MKTNIVRHPLFFLVLVITLALLPLFFGRFYAIGDIRDVFIPLETFYQQEMLAGRLPAWNPNTSWGFPVIASAQIGFFYPPLLIGRLFPISFYFPIILLSHFIAMGVGMYLFTLRTLPNKKTKKTIQYSALLSALTFTLSAFVWQHLTHLNILLAIAWFPWQMLLAHKLSRQPTIKLKHIALLILTIGLPFLIGQLQISLFVAAVSSLYFIYLRNLNTQTKLKKTFLSIGIIAVVAVGVLALVSVQLLPTLELLKYSSRNTTEGFDLHRANQHSYPIYHLPTMLFPRFYGSDNTYWGKRLEIEYGFFIGTIPLLLAFYSLFSKTKNKLSSLKFFKWLAIISFLLALGSLSPFRLIGLEPSLWFFSGPARFLLFTTFSLSMLAGHSLSSLEKKPVKFLRFTLYTLVIITAFVLVTNIFLFSLKSIGAENIFNSIKSTAPHLVEGKPASYYTEKLASMIDSALLSTISIKSPFTFLPILALALLSLNLTAQHIKKFILAITIIELMIIATTTTYTIPWSDILTPPESIKQLPQNVQKQQARIFSVRDGGDSGAMFTDPSSRADKTDRENQRQLIVPLLNAQFNIPGVEWPASLFLRSQELALDGIRKEHSYTIYNLDAARELNIETILHEENGQIIMQNINAQPRAELINNPDNNKATYTSINPGHISITTNSTTKNTLLVRDTWYPGWQAYIDGQPAPIKQKKPFFRTVDIPSGEHTIEMKYTSQSIYKGLLVSGTMLIFLMLVIANTLTKQAGFYSKTTL